MRTIVESASPALAIKFVQSITIRWPGMQALHPFFAFLLSAALPVLSLAADPRHVAEAAGDRCEAAAAETVRQMRGDDALHVEFIRRSVEPPVGGEADVKGEGAYRGAEGAARRFSFRCLYHIAPDTTSGVVFRDIDPPRTKTDTDARWQPDLSVLSPESCETAVATVLKSKYPRVGRIAFGSDSRKLRPASSGRTAMEGQGSVERAPGMNLIAFSYVCEFEPRSSQVVLARTAP